MDEESDAGHEKHHCHGQGIDLESEVDHEVARGHPGEQHLLKNTFLSGGQQETDEDKQGGEKGQSYRSGGNETNSVFPNAQAKEPINDGTDKRVQRYQPGQFQ